MTDATPPPQPISYRVPDAVKATGLSRSRIYKLLADGELRARKCGDATIIERAELERFIASLPYREPTR